MLPLRQPKASAFPFRQPHNENTFFDEPPKPRHSSFGRLILGDHRRAAAGQYRRTTDTTVKVREGSSDHTEEVDTLPSLCDRQVKSQGSSTRTSGPVVDIRKRQEGSTTLHSALRKLSSPQAGLTG